MEKQIQIMEVQDLEDPDDCWNYVEAAFTTLAADVSASATSIQVADSSIFPSSGAVQLAANM